MVCKPRHALCRNRGRSPNKTTTLEVERFDTIDNVKTKIQGRLRGGMQIFVKTRRQSSQQDSCGERLRGPDKNLAGDVCEATTRLAHGKVPPPCHRSNTMTSLPAWQAPAWWHVDLREDPATAPAERPASQLGIACLVISGACRDGVTRRQTGQAVFPSPIKLGARKQRIQCVCPKTSLISMYTAATLHLLYACTPMW